MRSIGHYLESRLYVGFTVVLALGSLALAGAMHFFDVREFDGALKTQAEILSQFIFEHPGAIEVDFADEYLPEFERADAPDYFQVRFADGALIERSALLSTNDLPFFPGRTEPLFRDLVLPDGRPGRLVQLALAPRTDVRAVDEDETDLTPIPAGLDGARPTVVLTVAWGRKALDAVLLTVSFIVAAEMLVLIGLLAFLVHRFLRRGFRPIAEMNAQIRELGPRALDRRVQLPVVPAELQPVLAALNGFLDDLQNAFARERRFTSDVAHELRTPIAEFRLACEIGGKWPDDARLVQARFAEMREASLDMERKVNGLLQLSRLDQNAVAAECRSVPLRAFVQAAWERLGGPEPRRFDNRLPPAAAVRTDPEKLGMIVENLLRNARDYSPADATVAVYPDPAGDSDYAICFANPAPDLAPADLDHLFERFWRKDAARSSGQRFGLGLSIVKALADLLDVRIQTRLAPDGTFVVRLAFPRREDS